jgi:hypothetical protein
VSSVPGIPRSRLRFFVASPGRLRATLLRGR